MVGGGKPKPAKDLTPEDKKVLMEDFESEYQTTFASAGSNPTDTRTCSYELTEADGFFSQTGFVVQDPFWQYWRNSWRPAPTGLSHFG